MGKQRLPPTLKSVVEIILKLEKCQDASGPQIWFNGAAEGQTSFPGPLVIPFGTCGFRFMEWVHLPASNGQFFTPLHPYLPTFFPLNCCVTVFQEISPTQHPFLFRMYWPPWKNIVWWQLYRKDICKPLDCLDLILRVALHRYSHLMPVIHKTI